MEECLLRLETKIHVWREGLHQGSSLHYKEKINVVDITYLYEPMEEFLLHLETKRHVSMIITQSRRQINTSSPGYQPPMPIGQLKPLLDYEYEGEYSQKYSNDNGCGHGWVRGREVNIATLCYDNFNRHTLGYYNS